MSTVASKPAKAAPMAALNSTMSAGAVKDKSATPAHQGDAPPTVDRARSMGAETASEWLSNDSGLQKSLTLPAWRAEMHADFVGAYKSCAGFMELLSAWERGFDSIVSALSDPAAVPDAIHEPFSWVHGSLRHDSRAKFLAMTKTVCVGVVTCLELVQRNTMMQDNCETPLLTVNDSEALLMLATASAQLLSESAEDRISFLNDLAMKEATA
jgi:hypothetical protein